MLTNNENPKEWIKAATEILLGNKKYDKITTLDIIKKAGVSRSTFYNNYSSKEEVFEEITFEGFDSRLLKTIDNEKDIYEALKKFISFVYEYKDIVMNIQTEKATEQISKLLIRIFEVFEEKYIKEEMPNNLDINENYKKYIVAVGIGIVDTLVNNKFNETEEELFHILTNILNLNHSNDINKK